MLNVGITTDERRWQKGRMTLTSSVSAVDCWCQSAVQLLVVAGSTWNWCIGRSAVLVVSATAVMCQMEKKHANGHGTVIHHVHQRTQSRHRLNSVPELIFLSHRRCQSSRPNPDSFSKSFKYVKMCQIYTGYILVSLQYLKNTLTDINWSN